MWPSGCPSSIPPPEHTQCSVLHLTEVADSSKEDPGNDPEGDAKGNWVLSLLSHGHSLSSAEDESSVADMTREKKTAFLSKQIFCK